MLKNFGINRKAWFMVALPAPAASVWGVINPQIL